MGQVRSQTEVSARYNQKTENAHSQKEWSGAGAIDERTERIETNLVWLKLKTVKTSPGLNDVPSDCDSKAQSG